MADMSRQVLGGKWGKCFVTVGDETFDLITLKNVEIKYDKSKSEVNQLNDAVTKHKTSGISYTGSATIYYQTPLFRKMALEYATTGKDIYFNMQIINDDVGSDAGTQSVYANGCNIDSGVIAILDVESDALEESIDFTINEIITSDEFADLPK